MDENQIRRSLAAAKRELETSARVPVPEVRRELSPSLPQGSRTVVLGDLQGDLQGLLVNLLSAGLISDEGKWIGGKSTFVQMGDILDRGPHSVQGRQRRPLAGEPRNFPSIELLG
jgi:hypothetical protein